MSNNLNSVSFTGFKYCPLGAGDVVNTYFNYRIVQNGKGAKNKIAKLLKAQENNPHHIILDYRGIEDSHEIMEKAIVDGKEFIRKPFESIFSLFKRAAKYADKIKKEPVQKHLYEKHLRDFVLNI